jgi:hypothetical protein
MTQGKKTEIMTIRNRISHKTATVLLCVAMLICGAAILFGQDSSLSIRLTTVTYNGQYAPRNVGAIWIEDSTGKFVKSVKVWAAARKQYLTNWQTSSAGNTVDAVTSATITTHQTHNVTWNCTDVNKAVVANGNYRVRFEFTEANATGKVTAVNFTKGTSSQTITPANETNFTNMQLVFTAGLTPAPTAVPTAIPTTPPTAVPTVPPTTGPTSVPTSPPTPGPTNTPTGLLGDVNGSGAVDIVDALVTAQYYVGLNPPNFNPAVADVNCSQAIDIVDALVIAQYYVGLIAQFPCVAPTPDASQGALYVSFSGSDSNTGTDASPFLTIQKGISSLSAGKTLYIKAGTYNEKLTVASSGTARSPIAIRNFGTDVVRIDGTGKTASHIIDLGNRSYVEISGLEIRNNTVTDGCGIYVNAGRNISIESCYIHDCNIGIRIDATAGGTTASGIVVSGNALNNNAKAAISLGGATYNSTGKAVNCHIINNTCYMNDTTSSGQGELALRWAENNVVKSNIFYSASQNLLLSSQAQGNLYNALNFNLWYSDAGNASARFVWNGSTATGFSSYLSVSAQDANSKFAQPAFVAPGTASPDFRLQAGSPAIDSGDPAFAPYGTDLGGNDRANGLRVDIGAFEY